MIEELIIAFVSVNFVFTLFSWLYIANKSDILHGSMFTTLARYKKFRIVLITFTVIECGFFLYFLVIFASMGHHGFY